MTLQVSHQTQEPPSEFLPAALGIQQGASRRTGSAALSLLVFMVVGDAPLCMTAFSAPVADAPPTDQLVVAPPTDQLVVRAAVAAFLGRYRGQSRVHTDSDLRVFLHWCTEQNLDPLTALRVDIERYVRWLQDVRRYQPSTVSRRLSVAVSYTHLTLPTIYSV